MEKKAPESKVWGYRPRHSELQGGIIYPEIGTYVRKAKEKLNPWRILTYDEFLAELALLGLKGRDFNAEAYAQALAAYLRVKILIRSVSELGEMNTLPSGRRPIRLTRLQAKSIQKEMTRTGHLGDCRPYLDTEPRYFLVIVADGLGSLLREATVCHELAHIAGNHFSSQQSLPNLRTLNKRRPPASETLREAEADTRARYTMLAGQVGRMSLQSIRSTMSIELEAEYILLVLEIVLDTATNNDRVSRIA